MTAPAPSDLARLLAEAAGLPPGLLRVDTSFARMGIGAPELERFARRLAERHPGPLPNLVWDCDTLTALSDHLVRTEAASATDLYRLMGFRLGLPDATFYE